MARLYAHVGDLGVLHTFGGDGQGLGAGRDFLEGEAATFVGEDGLVRNRQRDARTGDRAAGFALHAAFDGAGLLCRGLDDEVAGALLAGGEAGAGEELLQGREGLELALHGVGRHGAEGVGVIDDLQAGLLDEGLDRGGRGLGRDVELGGGGEREGKRQQEADDDGSDSGKAG